MRSPTTGGRWWTAFWLSALIPALTYYPAFALGGTFVTPSACLPQGITNQIVVWALINAAITLALMPFAPKRACRIGLVGPSILIAIVTVAIGYLALWLADAAFKIDFRFWIVALKLMSAKQWLIFLIYLLPFIVFFVIALHVLHRNFSRPWRRLRHACSHPCAGAERRLHHRCWPCNTARSGSPGSCSTRCPIRASCRSRPSSPSSSYRCLAIVGVMAAYHLAADRIEPARRADLRAWW